MKQSDLAWQQRLSNELEYQKYLAARIQAELEFADGLSEIEGKGTWPKLIAKARDLVAQAAGGKIGQFAKAVSAAEELLSPIGKAAKKYTVHCVGHAHIDMNWMWSWPETVAVTNDTVTTILKLMDEFPDFCFSQSQASVYEILRKYSPALWEQVKRRIAEGRWEVTAVHWVEGDKNIASGEALAHHLLYTRQYFAQHMGLQAADVPLDWEPDTFGHAATIPSIVSRGGVKRYYLCRGGRSNLPAIFWWKGPDGSRILVNRETTWYNDSIREHVGPALLRFHKMTGLKDWLFVYGVGDHGGGPTRRDLQRAADFNTWPVWPKFKLGTTAPYFELVESMGDKWPTLEGELNFEFTGCYTTQTQIKKANRFGENFCVEAQTAAALAWRALGREYPTADIREAWINTLFGQFHDILPGSGVRATRQYQMGLFQNTAATTNMIKTHSYRQFAAAVDTSFAQAQQAGKVAPSVASQALGAGSGRNTGEGGMSTAAHVTDGPRPFVVFNPTAQARKDTVVATIWDGGSGMMAGDVRRKNFVIRRPDGTIVGAQRVGQGDYWGHDFVELAVPVSVGPMGYASFAIEEGVEDKAGPVKATEGVRPAERDRNYRPCVMENEYLHVEIDYATGGISRLVDLATGRDLACADRPMAVLEYVLERPRGMTAWVINDAARRSNPEITSVVLTQTGPTVAAVEVKLKIENSTATLVYQVRAGVPYVEVSLDVNWLEMGGREKGTPNLSIRFPLALQGAKGRYEIPFGSIVRDVLPGQEVPSLRWADVTGDAGDGSAAGCLIANDCKYGHSLDGSTLSVTLLRSSSDPDPLPEVGQFTMKFAIAPHGRELPVDQCIAQGSALNHPLVVISTDVHKAALPTTAELVSCDAANVVITNVKKAEGEDALIVRLVETQGDKSSASVCFDGMLGKVAMVSEVDLLEHETKAANVSTSQNNIKLTIAPHAIVSLKVKFE